MDQARHVLGVVALLDRGLRPGPQRLLQDGVYRIVRHPVDLSALVSGIAYALFVNDVGVYILFALAFPVFYTLTIVEEREFVDRFGDDYRSYQREVPRFIPKQRIR